MIYLDDIKDTSEALAMEFEAYPPEGRPFLRRSYGPPFAAALIIAIALPAVIALPVVLAGVYGLLLIAILLRFLRINDVWLRAGDLLVALNKWLRETFTHKSATGYADLSGIHVKMLGVTRWIEWKDVAGFDCIAPQFHHGIGISLTSGERLFLDVGYHWTISGRLRVVYKFLAEDFKTHAHVDYDRDDKLIIDLLEERAAHLAMRLGEMQRAWAAARSTYRGTFPAKRA